MTAITVSLFRPFSSREDEVIALRFAYDAELVALLKATLAALHQDVRDPARSINNAGGWLPRCGCWFIEPSIWPTVHHALASAGYTMPEDVDVGVAAGGAT